MFTDFQYGTEMLSDYGLIVCQFDSAIGARTISTGSQLTFNTVKTVGSSKFNLYGAQYNEGYSITFQCCKVDEDNYPQVLSTEEFCRINRWLNRRDKFQEFKTDETGFEHIRYFGSFNVQAIKVNNVIYGIECNFTSNSPFAYADEITVQLTGKQFRLYDTSDEIGELYPHTTITCLESGDLQISNSLDNEITVIRNCQNNEVITIDNEHKIVTSSLASHNITNDFNYNYLKIVNQYNERYNLYTSNLNIKAVFKYSPIRKVGI